MFLLLNLTFIIIKNYRLKLSPLDRYDKYLTIVYVAQFKLEEHTRVQLQAYYMSKEIFITCLHAHKRLMT